MPDKLTNMEIVKDLNEAEDLENVLLYCKNPNKEVMTPIKITDIRDLINRLQKENERLKKEFIEQNLKNIKRLEISKEIKAEAYKEFADRLKEIAFKTLLAINDEKMKESMTYWVSEYKLDILLKELIGE